MKKSDIWVFALLVLVGCMQMFGDVFGIPILKGFGLATSASPAPKVFTAHQGFETYANQFFIEYTDADNQLVSLHITPEIYQRLKGPYNRRNMYGAATSYGPVLISNDLTRDMVHSVLNYAFCDQAPLLKEFGVTSHQHNTAVRVRLKPIGKNTAKFPLTFTASCDE